MERKTYAKLDLFKRSGRRLASIYDGGFPLGEHTFTVSSELLKQLQAGTYVVLKRTHERFETRKVMEK